MSKRDPKILFIDIIEAIDKIERYTKDIGFEQFIENSMLMDAVVRNVEIIGEAAKNIPEEIQRQFFHIPWKKIMGLRNRIVHEYFGIDQSIIWFIIKNEIPLLKSLIAQAYDQLPSR